LFTNVDLWFGRPYDAPTKSREGKWNKYLLTRKKTPWTTHEPGAKTHHAKESRLNGGSRTGLARAKPWKTQGLQKKFAQHVK
jgi:hypothetical protein